MPKVSNPNAFQDWPDHWAQYQTTITFNDSNRSTMLYALEQFPEFDDQIGNPAALINRIMRDWYLHHSQSVFQNGLDQLSEEHAEQTELLQKIASAVEA